MMVDPNSSNDPAGVPDPRPEERRHAPDRRQRVAPADGLHRRIEDKRRAIEQERREFVRRLTDGSTDGH
jgi:hypothetical protein